MRHVIMQNPADLLKDYTDFHANPDSKLGDKGNGILYDMCRRYPKHENIDEIIAKIWLIGRSYAAAIERRKDKKEESNDSFYISVAKDIKKFGFDAKINEIPNIDKLDSHNMAIICGAHYYITEKFYSLTKLRKRSLASKYMHFHRPIVPIYDSRARSSISGLFNSCEFLEVPHCKEPMNGDLEYIKFAKKVFQLQKFLLENRCQYFAVRDIDKYLVELQERKSRERLKGRI